MLGIIFLFIIGKQFYKLAEEYSKSKWGFAILGIVTYYAGTFITAIIYGLIYFSMYPEASEESVETIYLTLAVIVFGILSSVILYFILESNWKKNQKVEKKAMNIDDIGKDKPKEV